MAHKNRFRHYIQTAVLYIGVLALFAVYTTFERPLDTFALFGGNVALSVSNVEDINISASVVPLYTSDSGDRSYENYAKVIDQFHVDTNPRYAKRWGYTYCNIFVWDVTLAMNCEIPHFYDPETGESSRKAGYLEMTANRLAKWLDEFGPKFGWWQVDARTAQAKANEGYPVITSWYNKGGTGHTQIVRPSSHEFDEAKGPEVAQAGSVNRNGDFFASAAFIRAYYDSVRFFWHN